MYENFTSRYKNVLITGGYGFIGSCLIRNLLINTKSKICNIDKLNYASNLNSISSLFKEKKDIDEKRYYFEKIDLNERTKVELIFQKFKPDIVFHLAAETHVDRSILNPKLFIENNILATFNLLEVAKNYWEKIERERNDFLFIHVSTDEVFGSLGDQGFFNENTPYKPNSPYSASKASSDHLAKSWNKTFNFPSIVTNCSNNYGPWQYPDKLIPVIINNALNQEKIPIYGNGRNIRDWLHVEDHVEALILTALCGKVGNNYCIGSGNERTNLEIALHICEIIDSFNPKNSPHKELINFTKDRLGHDYRYSIDNTFAKNTLGWQPKFNFDKGLKSTVSWYIKHKNMLLGL